MTKIFCDIADINLIRSFTKKKIVKGFTTNPSLMRKAGAKNYSDYCKRILKITKKPISFEVFADDTKNIIKQAQKIKNWGNQIYVKIPVTNSKGIFLGKAIKTLNNKNIKLNITAVYSSKQTLKILNKINKKTKVIISIFSGRMGDKGKDPVPEIEKSISFSKKFMASLGLENNPITTQIEPNDSLAELLHGFVRINNILTDMSVDMWLYIQRNVFIQKNKAGEVGSSTMPHKINPIFFENAEGNLEIANTNLNFLSTRLCRSRLQRDLSGSTLFRNIGTAFGHSFLAYKNINKGLERVQPNKVQMGVELENSWGILAEAIQTVLRKNGEKKAYQKIKTLTRGKVVDKEKYMDIISALDVSDEDRAALVSLSPATYLGEVEKILKKY